MPVTGSAIFARFVPMRLVFKFLYLKASYFGLRESNQSSVSIKSNFRKCFRHGRCVEENVLRQAMTLVS
jgi:hypothetical protein